ncbi:MAG TPA: hypothetical protein VKU90_06550 [Caulobacteraceae bacterium]|nr:hypothetical protein [Caulobacteraceae bacterium]
MTDDNGAPIACTLGVGEAVARLAWIGRLNAASLRECRREGLRLELVYAPDARDQVLEVVRAEAACCPFLAFVVEETPGAVRVVIEAPEAARFAVAAIFAPFQSKASLLPACCF